MDGTWYVRRGRIGRKTYWLHYALPISAATILAAVLDISLGLAWYSQSYSSYGYDYHYSATFMGGPLYWLTTLALFAPSISAAVTRLHDTGKSGWWLLWGLVPIAGPIVLLVVIGFLAGEWGPNRYGDPEGYVRTPSAQPTWSGR